jgi:hypothetical protein
MAEVKRQGRLNPAAVLDEVASGKQPDRDTIARVREELIDPCSIYDKETLIKILSRSNARECIPDITREFLEATDPFVVYAALNALFRWWSEDPSSPTYMDRVRSLAGGLEWDSDQLVAEAARKL